MNAHYYINLASHYTRAAYRLRRMPALARIEKDEARYYIALAREVRAMRLPA